MFQYPYFYSNGIDIGNEDGGHCRGGGNVENNNCNGDCGDVDDDYDCS